MAINKILTIGIPTYNRASDLDKCLSSLLNQVQEFEEYIEIFISDNNSEDQTSEIVQKYVSSGFKINLFRQKQNVGMDKNFATLYEKCQTKYLWLFSDDDILLPDGLNKIMHILKHKEAGVLYLNNYWYDKQIDFSKIEINEPIKYVEYNDSIKFVERVNYWFTFLTGNIINKDIIKDKIDIYEFDQTYLLQLSWVIPAVFQGISSFVIENTVLACKANNTGGYKLYKVFGKNFNYVMDKLIKKGYDKRLKKIINYHLINNFFPAFLCNNSKNFEKENYFSILFPIFWKYPIFWRKIMPILIKKHIQASNKYA